MTFRLSDVMYFLHHFPCHQCDYPTGRCASNPVPAHHREFKEATASSGTWGWPLLMSATLCTCELIPVQGTLSYESWVYWDEIYCSLTWEDTCHAVVYWPCPCPYTHPPSYLRFSDRCCSGCKGNVLCLSAQTPVGNRVARSLKHAQIQT